VFVVLPVKELAGLGCAYHEYSYTMCYVTLVDTLAPDGAILVCNAVLLSPLCDELMMISLCLCSSVCLGCLSLYAFSPKCKCATSDLAPTCEVSMSNML
jgi:hypothetical protein